MLNAPIERAWELVRDFNGLPRWMAGMKASGIEEGQDASAVGAVRCVTLEGTDQKLRERLLALSDAEHTITYCVLEGPLPVQNVVTTMRLRRVTDSNATYGEWSSEFDTEPGREQAGIEFLSRVFGSGWRQLMRYLRGVGF